MGITNAIIIVTVILIVLLVIIWTWASRKTDGKTKQKKSIKDIIAYFILGSITVCSISFGLSQIIVRAYNSLVVHTAVLSYDTSNQEDTHAMLARLEAANCKIKDSTQIGDKFIIKYNHSRLDPNWLDPEINASDLSLSADAKKVFRNNLISSEITVEENGVWPFSIYDRVCESLKEQDLTSEESETPSPEATEIVSLDTITPEPTSQNSDGRSGKNNSGKGTSTKSNPITHGYSQSTSNNSGSGSTENTEPKPVQDTTEQQNTDLGSENKNVQLFDDNNLSVDPVSVY